MAAPNIKSGSSVTTVTGKTVGYAVTTTMAAALSNGSSSGKVLKINSVYCANVDGTSAADISLQHWDGTTGFELAHTISVPADATQVLVTREAYIYLEEGHSLRAQASAASDLELVISYEEIS
jgi:hypothetical protein